MPTTGLLNLTSPVNCPWAASSCLQTCPITNNRKQILWTAGYLRLTARYSALRPDRAAEAVASTCRSVNHYTKTHLCHLPSIDIQTR